MEFLNTLSVPHVLLFLGLMLVVSVLYSAHKNKSFDVSELLKAPDGKPSATRFASLVALVISSWVVVSGLTKLSGSDFNSIFMLYVLTWSGSKTVETVANAWAAKGSPSSGSVFSQRTSIQSPVQSSVTSSQTVTSVYQGNVNNRTLQPNQLPSHSIIDPNHDLIQNPNPTFIPDD